MAPRRCNARNTCTCDRRDRISPSHKSRWALVSRPRFNAGSVGLENGRQRNDAMAVEPTLPSESTPDPDAVPTTADDHITLTGNASIRSMATGRVTQVTDTPHPLRAQIDPAILLNWDQPHQPQQPPRPSI